MIAFFMVMR